MTSATNIPVHVKKNRTAGDWAILILLIVGGLVMLFPFIVLLLNAFKTTADYNSSGPLSWPKEFSTVGLMKFWNRAKKGGRKSFRLEELDPEFFMELRRGSLVPYLDGINKDLDVREQKQK